eukprot:762065-Hanusia_phi.AAC.1
MPFLLGLATTVPASEATLVADTPVDLGYVLCYNRYRFNVSHWPVAATLMVITNQGPKPKGQRRRNAVAPTIILDSGACHAVKTDTSHVSDLSHTQMSVTVALTDS